MTRLLLSLIRSHWRGHNGLVLSALVPCVLLWALYGASTWVFDSVDWVWHYRLAAAVSLALIGLMLAVAVWGLMGAARAAERGHNAGVSALHYHAATALVAASALATAGPFALEVRFWTTAMWKLVRDADRSVTLQVDAAGQTLQVRGPFGFGTTRRVDEALRAHPGVQRVELDSPGGYAIEGLALARVLEARGVDTQVRARCASACITAYAAGERRTLGPQGKLGLHAASISRRRSKEDVDEAHAQFLTRRGVAGWLVRIERATPNNDLWVPGPAELLGSGLVTDLE